MRETLFSVTTRRPIYIFFFAFAFSFFIGFTIQKLILPYVFTNLHWGEGLMAGRDWVKFHLDAIKALQLLKDSNYYDFFFNNPYSRISITTAVAYYLFFPTPLSFLILNSFIYACSLYLIFHFLKLSSKNLYILGIYFIFPSTLILYTQIHKDIFTLISILLTLFSYKTHKYSHLVLFVFLGLFFSWLNRPYQLTIFFCVFLIQYILLFMFKVIDAKKLLVFSLTAIIVSFSLFRISSISSLPEFKNYNTTSESNDFKNYNTTSESNDFKNYWTKTPFLPRVLDNNFYALANFRNGMNKLKKNNDSSIDADINFHSALDIIHYTPRALQISLFSPFPTFWIKTFRPSSNNNSKLERLTSTIEMFIAYIIFALFLVVVAYKKLKYEQLILILTIILLIVPLSLVFSNLGTLYRMRLPYMLVLITLILNYLTTTKIQD